MPLGLRYCRDFVTCDEEEVLIAALDDPPGHWLGHLKSRAQQFFGLVYYHTTHDLHALQPVEDELQHGRPMGQLPAWLVPRVVGTGVYPGGAAEINQIAANEYTGHAGISHHVEDVACFGANLATLSLLEPIELTLTPVEACTPEAAARAALGVDGEDWVKVLLEPRSLFVLQGESRYRFKHGIRRSKLVPLPTGEVRRRGGDYRRVSLTFRELLSTRRMLEGSPVRAALPGV